MIQAKKIYKHYGNKTVLKDISIDLPKGKLITFIGPNGAGKSTLLSLISRLQPQSSGELYLEGTEVKAWRSKVYAQKLGMLKQNNHLPLNITVKELVEFGRFPYNRGKLKAEDAMVVKEALTQMALSDLQDEPIQALSGGQLQRTYIAMVLAQDTEYILLDEPLNNLDMNHANQMMHRLRNLVDEKQKTVIVVLHDINFASSFADYIVALKDGEIFAEGQTEMIIQPEILNQLYSMDIRICEVEGKRFCMYFS